MGTKHKQETKMREQFVDTIREVIYGFEPLYATNHKRESEQTEEQIVARKERYRKERR